MLNEEFHKEYPDWWADFSKKLAGHMRYNHKEVVNNFAKQIPTYIVRYEDLLTDPEPILNEVFRFLLDVNSIEGTVVEQRIKEVS